MAMKRTLAILLSCLGAPLVHAQSAALDHSTPAPQEMVLLDFNGGNSSYEQPADVSMAGNRIKVVYTLPGVDFPEPPPAPAGGYRYQTQLGKFPAGDYVVEVMAGPAAAPALVATIPFHVVESDTKVQPIEDHTDIWWNPAESGWGLNLVQHGAGPIFATWFVYGADGNPEWYVIPGGRWTSRVQFTGASYRTSGPDIAGTFDPSKVTRTQVGTAVLNFTDGGLQALLTVDGQTTNKILQRQSF